MDAELKYTDERIRLVKWFEFTKEDKEFFECLPMPGLELLLEAANFLDVPKLFWYSAQEVARRIRGKDANTIRRILCKRNC